MTLRTQHEKPVYVRLRETIADAILAGKYGTATRSRRCARLPRRSRRTR